MKIKVIEFKNLKGATSNILTDYTYDECLKKNYNLLNKIVAFSDDYCNITLSELII